MARPRREVNPPVREESSEEESDGNSDETPVPPAPQDQAAPIVQLIRSIQDQNAQMQASQNAMNQIQMEAALYRQREAAAVQQQLTADQARAANVAAANLAGGVYGYQFGATLSANV